MDNESFWENQYRRNLGRITGLCYLYVGDQSVAEDLAHDIFLKAMEKFHTIRAVFNFDTWLKRIAVNQCIDYLRQQPNFVPLPVELADEEDTEDAVLWVKDITADELAETIRQLPELQRTVFNLYAIEGYSHKRIATLLGISVDNSKQLHHRARARLGKMLADKYEVKKTDRKD
jgi:RNA polymerase sigma-70 factor (ECF subfamily)